MRRFIKAQYRFITVKIVTQALWVHRGQTARPEGRHSPRRQRRRCLNWVWKAQWEHKLSFIFR